MSSIWKIPATRISETGLEIDEHVTAEWLTALFDEPGSEFRWQAVKSSHVKVLLMPEADMIRVTGDAMVVASCPCVRCMRDVIFQVPIKLNLRLSESSAVATEDRLEMEWTVDGDASLVSGDDIAVTTYEEGVIDVQALIREQLFLDLPAYPACDHPLAAQPQLCGFYEKNVLGDTQSIDNRWAPLAAWRNRLPTG